MTLVRTLDLETPVVHFDAESFPAISEDIPVVRLGGWAHELGPAIDLADPSSLKANLGRRVLAQALDEKGEFMRTRGTPPIRDLNAERIALSQMSSQEAFEAMKRIRGKLAEAAELRHSLPVIGTLGLFSTGAVLHQANGPTTLLGFYGSDLSRPQHVLRPITKTSVNLVR